MTLWSETSAAVEQIDLEHVQGDTFARTLDLEVDITDYEDWTMAVRSRYADAETTDNGDALVVLDEDEGVTVVVPEEEPPTAIELLSDAFDLPPRVYYYDVQAEKDGVRKTFVRGTFRILPHVTV